MKTFLITAAAFCALHSFGQDELPTFNLFQDTVYMTDTLIAGESYRLEWDRTEPNVYRVLIASGCALTKVSAKPNQDAYLCYPHTEATRVVIASKRVKGKTEIRDSIFVFQVKQP